MLLIRIFDEPNAAENARSSISCLRDPFGVCDAF